MTVTIGALGKVFSASLSCVTIALRSHIITLSNDIPFCSLTTDTSNSKAINDTVSKSSAVLIPPKILFASMCLRICGNGIPLFSENSLTEMTSLMTILSFFVNVPDTAASLNTLDFCTTGSFLTTGELLLLYEDLPLYHHPLVFHAYCGLGLY